MRNKRENFRKISFNRNRFSGEIFVFHRLSLSTGVGGRMWRPSPIQTLPYEAASFVTHTCTYISIAVYGDESTSGGFLLGFYNNPRFPHDSLSHTA